MHRDSAAGTDTASVYAVRGSMIPTTDSGGGVTMGAAPTRYMPHDPFASDDVGGEWWDPSGDRTVADYM